MDGYNVKQSPKATSRRARAGGEAGLPLGSLRMASQSESSPDRGYGPPRAHTNAFPARATRPSPQVSAESRPAGQRPGHTIPRPAPVPQWPLGASPENDNRQRVDHQQYRAYEPPSGHRNPPRRPLRPSQAPGYLDTSEDQEPTRPLTLTNKYPKTQMGQSHADSEQINVYGPPQGMTFTSSSVSRPSTVSSVGTIPDFPVPVPTVSSSGLGRGPNIGPPPSSRRGISSYYSSSSLVASIPEENHQYKPPHRSYASSAAIPSSWEPDTAGFNFYVDDDERFPDNYIIEEGEESRESFYDDGEERELVRSASIGRRGKPNMVTTKSSDRLREGQSVKQVNNDRVKDMPGFDAVAAMTGRGGMDSVRPGPYTVQPVLREGPVWPVVREVNSALSGGTGLLDPSSSSSETIPSIGQGALKEEPSLIVPRIKSEPHIGHILSAHEAASTLNPTSLTSSEGSVSRLSTIRRPPRLNLDVVREAESRGSLTSLPDLIRRATKLATMMEIGKRPGSRLDDLDESRGQQDLGGNNGGRYGDKHARRSALSNMLNAFPSPGLNTPTTYGPSGRGASPWPMGFSAHATARSLSRPPDTPASRRRRCCGLPIWAFLLMLLAIACLIVAAIVIPVELLVVHKPKHAARPAQSSLSACQANTTCANGGSNTISSGVCACICTNGFTGETCTVAGSSGCTTINLNSTDESSSSSSTYTNVTLGASIPRLVQQAQANFSVPLSGAAVLARFNAAGLSCDSENALVTFGGSAHRLGKASSSMVVATMTTAASSSSSTPVARRDSAATTTAHKLPGPADVSILHDQPATTVTATATATGEIPNASSPAFFTVTPEVLDFARVVVLYVLQQAELNSAIVAQTEITNFLEVRLGDAAAMNVSLGNGNSVDFVKLIVDAGGQRVGGGLGSRSV
ncbi:MAG: hypothetical protein M1818_004968 [Claussenomyces sp. TS43310]|nr:MAG: hypothetical protein M1818_004968 [Claussenomyces sp. TS43310]